MMVVPSPDKIKELQTEADKFVAIMKSQRSAAQLAKSLPTLFSQAKAYHVSDREKAYTLYYRYVKLYQHVSKDSSVPKDANLKKNAISAMDALEALQKQLDKTSPVSEPTAVDEEAEMMSLPAFPEVPTNKKTTNGNHTTVTAAPVVVATKVEARKLSTEEFYRLYRAPSSDSSSRSKFVLIDLRSSADFERVCLINSTGAADQHLLNIPPGSNEGILVPGLTFAKCAAKLKDKKGATAGKLFGDISRVDEIVLLTQSGTDDEFDYLNTALNPGPSIVSSLEDNPTTIGVVKSIFILIRALVEYSTTPYCGRFSFVSGGMRSFTKRYGQFTSNASAFDEIVAGSVLYPSIDNGASNETSSETRPHTDLISGEYDFDSILAPFNEPVVPVSVVTAIGPSKHIDRSSLPPKPPSTTSKRDPVTPIAQPPSSSTAPPKVYRSLKPSNAPSLPSAQLPDTVSGPPRVLNDDDEVESLRSSSASPNTATSNEPVVTGDSLYPAVSATALTNKISANGVVSSKPIRVSFDDAVVNDDDEAEKLASTGDVIARNDRPERSPERPEIKSCLKTAGPIGSIPVEKLHPLVPPRTTKPPLRPPAGITPAIQPVDISANASGRDASKPPPSDQRQSRQIRRSTGPHPRARSQPGVPRSPAQTPSTAPSNDSFGPSTPLKPSTTTRHPDAAVVPPSVDRKTKPSVSAPRPPIDGSIAWRKMLSTQVDSFNPVYSSSESEVPPGLKNLGNTCYMNSILQCLNAVGPLVA